MFSEFFDIGKTPEEKPSESESSRVKWSRSNQRPENTQKVSDNQIAEKLSITFPFAVINRFVAR